MDEILFVSEVPVSLNAIDFSNIGEGESAIAELPESGALTSSRAGSEVFRRAVAMVGLPPDKDLFVVELSARLILAL